MLDEAGELAGYEPIMDANADSQSLASAAIRRRRRLPSGRTGSSPTGFPLVVQLLRFALGPSSYNKHKDLLACEPQPW